MAMFGLNDGQRAQRKTLITVVEWGGKWDETGTTYTGGTRELLGARTEDSSIELNADIATSTDILGITYTDVNKTEPQQTFDPFYVMGGSALAEYLLDAMLKNDINAYNNTFNVYVIAGFLGEAGKLQAYRHRDCSVIPTSLGGDSYNSMPIEVHYSNNITEGTVDKLAADFAFTPAA